MNSTMVVPSMSQLYRKRGKLSNLRTGLTEFQYMLNCIRQYGKNKVLFFVVYYDNLQHESMYRHYYRIKATEGG